VALVLSAPKQSEELKVWVTSALEVVLVSVDLVLSDLAGLMLSED
jgi:hypothetical protein